MSKATKTIMDLINTKADIDMKNKVETRLLIETKTKCEWDLEKEKEKIIIYQEKYDTFIDELDSEFNFDPVLAEKINQ